MNATHVIISALLGSFWAGAAALAMKFKLLPAMTASKRTTRARSEYEEAFALQLRAVGLGDYEREFLFHPLRKWRFDFCFPDKMIALEVEGGIYSHGRHVTPAGFIDDCTKYNEAALLGWRVLRLPMTWIDNGQALHYAEMALRGKSDWTPMQY